MRPRATHAGRLPCATAPATSALTAATPWDAPESTEPLHTQEAPRVKPWGFLFPSRVLTVVHRSGSIPSLTSKDDSGDTKYGSSNSTQSRYHERAPEVEG